ncbi:30S ribosomal protein S17 [Gammaproteobacteria bacterium]|nr:30S ribosomal protein S17 [Gammaproteobacteria bacterium]
MNDKQTDSANESNARTAQGVVTSNKGHKSITVRVERRVMHPLYKKVIRRSTNLHAHDEDNVCNEGDIVEIASCRPLSKTKRWNLVKVVQVNKLAVIQSQNEVAEEAQSQ